MISRLRYTSKIIPGIAMTFFCCQSFAGTLSAGQILSMLQTQEPAAVVKALHRENHGQDWRYALSQIKTGAPDWLKVAYGLEKGLHGTRTIDQLLDAVTRALPENPSGVLHILNEHNYFLNTANICSFPLISAGRAADNVFMTNAFNAIQAQPDGTDCAKQMQRAAHVLPDRYDGEG